MPRGVRGAGIDALVYWNGVYCTEYWALRYNTVLYSRYILIRVDVKKIM